MDDMKTLAALFMNLSLKYIKNLFPGISSYIAFVKLKCYAAKIIIPGIFIWNTKKKL